MTTCATCWTGELHSDELKNQLGTPIPDDKITVFEPDLEVADPSKVYVLFRKNLFVLAFRNKIDAHREAVRRAEEDGDSLDDFHVESQRVVPDSGLRLKDMQEWKP